MNVIKGLVIKDILQLKSYKKTLGIFMVIFILISLTNQMQDNMRNMLTMMVTLGFGMFGIATFSYDEMAKADRYIITLPINKKQLVLSRYILVIGATIIGSILGAILNVAITFIMNKQMLDIYEQVCFSVGTIWGIGLVEAIQVPCIYKYGAEKGRLFVFFIIVILAFLVGGIFYMGEKVNIPIQMDNLNYIVEHYFPVILLVSTIVIYWISYKISLNIYRKKEI